MNQQNQARSWISKI